MKQEKRLMIEMMIVIILFFAIMGPIAIKEKARIREREKTQKELQEYYHTKYQEIKGELTTDIIISTNNLEACSKENSTLCFYIKKENGKIIDTYQEDYLEGQSIFKYIPRILEKEIKEKTQTEPTVTIPYTLNEYITATRERIINNDNLLELRFYTIEKEILIDTWSKGEITKKIINTIQIYESQNITPMNYTLTITNQNKITESIKIKNITVEFESNPYREEIINDIIKDNNSQLLKENKITYQYLNEEE